jgi:ABC-type transport system substrate-binding protein
MNRRCIFSSLLAAAALSLMGTAALAQAPAIEGVPASLPPAAPGQKVLRYAFPVAETGFDPAQISGYSNTIASEIFDAPLQFAFLGKPGRVRPNTLVAMPEISSDFKTFTFHVKPGIYFADDPAFKGSRRELVAADYVYAYKRLYDPRNKGTFLFLLENAKVLGLSELRHEALAGKRDFDYDREVEGLRTLDRYTFQIKLAQPSPRFLLNLTDSAWAGAVAREVVEYYGDRISEHPVGTGPFRLAAWRRASRIVLERNPGFREVRYDEQAPPGDAMAEAAVAHLQGKRLPLVDRVEISIIEETQPRWLAFLNGEHDLIEDVPPEYVDFAMPQGHLAPNLARRHIEMLRYPRAYIAFSYFNMEDPVVGGYTPDKVALRRAISLAVDIGKEIRLVRHNQAIPGQSLIAPGASGYDPAFKSEMSDFDPARAKALLDMYGYVDRDGDGWRDLPDGEPLDLEYAIQPDQQSRQLAEQWKKNMDAIGIRMHFKTAAWSENAKASTAGKLQMWGMGWGGSPDGSDLLALAYGPAKGEANHARFDLPAYNRVFEEQRPMPDGPEREAVFLEAKKLLAAYMPYKVHVHRFFTDLVQPWVIGYHHNTFIRSAWRYVDIDPDMQRKLAK